MKRQDQNLTDTWDLKPLFKNDTEWTKSLKEFEKIAHQLNKFRDHLAESAATLADFLDLYRDFNLLGDRLGSYCGLKECEDGANPRVQAMERRLTSVAGKISVLLSWRQPQILAIPAPKMREFLKHPRLKDYRVYLRRLLRGRDHALTETERRIESQFGENAGQSSQIYTVFTDTDLRFGDVAGQPLTQGSYKTFLESPDRALRREAYDKLYAEFDKYKNTLAALYANSVKEDWIYAKLHRFSTTLEAKLFANNVPRSVYENLIRTVSANLPALHRFYRLKAKHLGLKKLSHCDVYAPIVPDFKKTTSYESAVDLVITALAPLGEDYTATLRHGLTEGRWVDRYENEGKRSGAFSAGTYDSPPYILLNYNDQSFRDVSTLAHEAGHSMHTWYSARHQPYMQYDYTIFEAEVASTVNEELLTHHLLATVTDKQARASIISQHLDELLATLFRQTMFAEFELWAHEVEESGEPLTIEVMRRQYRKLLEKYFGPDVELPEVADLEFLRIPHFYSPYYVYQYATGISAAVALARKILSGEQGRADYFKMLKSGGSRFPIDTLRLAGVDMSKPEPIKLAAQEFERLVAELEQLLK
jgi:oligoendopeptidase F